uniref:Ribonuclease H-like domain-containing protein n=1 Tax=Tanacetum cinerariifolium TaxID=118510 RepID=A0A6L2N1W0_TANCI|nr:ribonuclease H-like domain-containing protein [Tanacetum cinerariifolium]
MVDEYNALISNQTWALVPRPHNVNVVRSMWLFRHKFNADDDIILTSSSPDLLQWIIALLYKEVLERAYMKTYNPCQTPVNTKSKLGSDNETLYVSSTPQLTAYTNADWAGCLVTRRSTSGYCVFLGNNLLSGSAKRQVTLSRSSAEAEYHAVANIVAKIS